MHRAIAFDIPQGVNGASWAIDDVDVDVSPATGWPISFATAGSSGWVETASPAA